MNNALATTPNNGTPITSIPAASPASPIKCVANLNTAALASISDSDVTEVIHKLLRMAKAGNVAAAREVLDRTLGKPTQRSILEATVAAQREENEPLDHWGEMRKAFDLYAKLMIPKQAWLPGHIAQYRAWQQSNGNGHRPADWDQIAERVEARCNWIRMTPEAANDWRTGCMVYDGETLKMERGPFPISGFEEGEWA